MNVLWKQMFAKPQDASPKLEEQNTLNKSGLIEIGEVRLCFIRFSNPGLSSIKFNMAFLKKTKHANKSRKY